LDRDGAADQAEEQHHDREVERREDRRVGLRERREERAAEGDEPHLVAVPQRADAVEREAPLGVAAHEDVDDPDPEIEAVEDRVAEQQEREEHEPEDVEVHAQPPFWSSSSSSSESMGPVRWWGESMSCRRAAAVARSLALVLAGS